MNLLKDVKISFSQLVAWGLKGMNLVEIVKKLWGEEETLPLEKILNTRMHPHFVCWTLLRKDVLPERALHELAQIWVEEFVGKAKEGNVYMDFRLEELVALKRRWLENEVGTGMVEAGKAEAEKICEVMGQYPDEKARKVAGVVRSLLVLNATGCVQAVYFNTIGFGELSNEIIYQKWGEAWERRLQVVRDYFIALSEGKGKYSVSFADMHRQVLADRSPEPGKYGCFEPGTANINVVPIGTIVAYAGEITQSFEKDSGWMVCDGRLVDQEEYSELFHIIGTCWGGDGIKNFRLPDLRGVFLRGLDEPSANGLKTNSDKGGENRILANDEKGEGVGSFQRYATAVPKKSFQASLINGETDTCHFDKGCQGSGAQAPQDKEGTVVKGGNKESRPKNKAVYYLIKYTEKIFGQAVYLPVGSVIPFAGVMTDSLSLHWKLCNGDSCSKLGDSKALFEAIGWVHGGSDEEHFYLPDYRGYFLRGVSCGEGNDPDVDLRTSPLPAAIPHPGNSRGVGSVQDYATGLPANAFKVKVNVPSAEIDSVIEGVIRDLYKYNSGSVEANVSNGGGGDKETRPVNIAVDWYIFDHNQNVRSINDYFPVGGVMVWGADNKPDEKIWQLCDGRKLRKDSYPALYSVLQGVYKEEGDEFYLPDYRGYFMRGVSYDTDNDPDATARTKVNPAYAGEIKNMPGTRQEYATARPKGEANDFIAAIPNLPTGNIGVSGECYSNGAKKKGDFSIGAYLGGDSETRPVNVAVRFYIKVAE